MIKKLFTAWALHEKTVAVILIALLAIFPFLTSNSYYLGIGVMIWIYAILALGLNLISGYMGIISIGHAAFFGIGAYTAALLAVNYHWNFLLTFLFAMILSGIAGFLLGLPTLRLSKRYLAIMTISFCEVIKIVEMNWKSLTRGPLGIPNIPGFALLGVQISGKRAHYFMAMLLALLVCYVVSSIMNSRVGRVVSAIHDDEIAAEFMGVNLTKYKLLIFSVSSLIAGLGGAFYAHYTNYIDPSSFSADQSIFLLSIVILGGSGSIYGSILGAAVLTIIPELLRSLLSIRQVVYGILLVFMVLVRPQGLLGGLRLRHIRQQQHFRAETAVDEEVEE